MSSVESVGSCNSRRQRHGAHQIVRSGGGIELHDPEQLQAKPSRAQRRNVRAHDFTVERMGNREHQSIDGVLNQENLLGFQCFQVVLGNELRGELQAKRLTEGDELSRSQLLI